MTKLCAIRRSDPRMVETALLSIILLMWNIGWAPNNVSKWQMGFNSACKGLKLLITKRRNADRWIPPASRLHCSIRRFGGAWRHYFQVVQEELNVYQLNMFKMADCCYQVQLAGCWGVTCSCGCRILRKGLSENADSADTKSGPW
jgi:hypothetical protein